MPSASAPLVAAAIASARIFVVKGPALAAAEAPPTQAEPADPAGDPAFGDPGDPGPGDSGVGDPGPDEGDTTGAAPTSTP
jgi:hypothetical protein